MRVNDQHRRFKYEGETNYPYQAGQLEAIVQELARRVDFEENDGSAQEYVDQLKSDGVLED